ncbi:MAG: DNA cytosine methyltransferase [Caulobacter sp.]|nr:DNA cytosine methyltransferase [Caulobacter sp.]
MSRNAPPSFYEFFAGGGMARLGLGDHWRCLFANDFDPIKTATYRANFDDAEAHFHQGDVWAVEPADLPGRADLAWASSPCQDFSLAGARAGLEGGRSSSFFGFWRLMEALNGEGRAPRTIVIENVVGLLSSNGGRDFQALCRALADQGYHFGALEIDAAGFVPQSRPRVFVVATRSTPPPPLTGRGAFHTRSVLEAEARLPDDLRALWVWWRLAAPPTRNSHLSAMLEPDETATWRPPAETDRLLDLMAAAHLGRLNQARQAGRAVGTVFRRMRAGVQRAEIRLDGVAGCLRTPRGGSSRQTVVVATVDRVRSRLLTPREGARLMGLPDTYQLPRGDTAAFHVVGDGVAVPVVRWLASQLIEPLLATVDTALAAE